MDELSLKMDTLRGAGIPRRLFVNVSIDGWIHPLCSAELELGNRGRDCKLQWAPQGDHLGRSVRHVIRPNMKRTAIEHQVETVADLSEAGLTQ